jgi:hypothetical protein
MVKEGRRKIAFGVGKKEDDVDTLRYYLKEDYELFADNPKLYSKVKQLLQDYEQEVF